MSSQNPPSAASSSPSPAPRRRYRSTFVVGALTIATLILAIVPGQHHAARETWTHGWPWTYETRATIHDVVIMGSPAKSGSGPGALITPASVNKTLHYRPWWITTGVREFSPWLLTADVAVAIGIYAGVCFLWVRWRRQRHHVYQLHIRDILALTTAVAIACTWWVLTTRSCLAEQEAAEQLAKENASRQFTSESVLPSWLVQWLGPALRPRQFDRPVKFEIPEYEWEFLGSIDVVVIPSRKPNTIIEDLVAAAHLEEIQLGWENLDERGAKALGRFPHLRRFGLHTSLGVTPNEEVIAVVVQELAKLDQLEFLSLCAVISDETVANLQSLSHLRTLDLARAVLTRKGLADLAQLVQLCELNLQGTTYRLPSAPHFGSGVGPVRPVGDEDLAAVASLSNLTTLNLAGTQITDRGLERLHSMTRLKELHLPKANVRGVSQEGIDALQRALPELHIIVAQ